MRSNNPNLITAQRHYSLIVQSLNLNIGPDDMGTFVGLPAKYIVRRFTVYDASVSLGASAATVGLFTDSSGGGTTLVALATLTALTVASKFVDMTLAAGATADYRTETVLFIRNGARHGSAATVSAMLEIVDVTGITYD